MSERDVTNNCMNSGCQMPYHHWGNSETLEIVIKCCVCRRVITVNTFDNIKQFKKALIEFDNMKKFKKSLIEIEKIGEKKDVSPKKVCLSCWIIAGIILFGLVWYLFSR